MESEQVIALIVSLILGAIDVPLIDWLKNKLGLSGMAAMLLAYVASFVIAAVALFASGQLGYADLNLANLFTVAAVMISTSQLVYKQLNKVPQS
ncbi:MAG: hypothetical protein ACYSUC_11565 [Planctomycetota bacterium]|jgi:hypothetical protein